MNFLFLFKSLLQSPAARSDSEWQRVGAGGGDGGFSGLNHAGPLLWRHAGPGDPRCPLAHPRHQVRRTALCSCQGKNYLINLLICLLFLLYLISSCSCSCRCACSDKSLVCVEVSVGLLFVLPLTSGSPAFKSQPLTSIGLQQSENAPEVTLQKVPGSPSHMIIQVWSCVHTKVQERKCSDEVLDQVGQSHGVYRDLKVHLL